MQEKLENVIFHPDQLREKIVLLFEIFFSNSQDHYSNSEKFRTVFEIATSNKKIEKKTFFL